MTTKPTPKFKGELAKPLPEPTFGEFFQGQASEPIAQLIANRLRLLFEHYGIPQGKPDSGLALALRLAMDHVPGFQQREPLRKKPGRRAKWTGYRAIELHADVIERVRQGKSESGACAILAGRDKYRGTTCRSLLRRFKEVQKRNQESGWSDDDILEYVRLQRNPELFAERVLACAETLRKNSA